MSNINTAAPSELPSTRQLLRSTALAALIAAVLLFVAVLPAEYGFDLTGAGRVLGLTQMGEMKTSLAKENDQPAPKVEPAKAPSPVVTVIPIVTPASTTATSAPTSNPANKPVKTELITVTLTPGQSTEVKLVMRKNARVSYKWSVDKGKVNYDTHADSKNPPVDYHGYSKGRGATSDEGMLVAAFDGSHGWFWRNRTKETVIITLRVEGDYSEVKR
jgi:hypothetical protein